MGKVSFVDILDIIKQEHSDVSKKLAQASKCEPGDARLYDLVAEIQHALSTHVKIEERLLYSKLRDRAEDEEERVDVYEAFTEHDVADHVLQLLRSGRKPDEKFKAEVEVLGESVKHHVKEEESKIFGIAREILDPAERESLGEQWARARKRADAKPAPGRRSARKATAKAPARKRR